MKTAKSPSRRAHFDPCDQLKIIAKTFLARDFATSLPGDGAARLMLMRNDLRGAEAWGCAT
jgi:hypothetical protein